MKVAFGTYTGTGSAHTPVTGIAFAPDVVIVQGGANAACIRTSTMAGDKTKSFNANATATARITAITSDGFSVGTNAGTNANGTVYTYMVIGCEAADSKVGSYTGTGSSLPVTGVGFQGNALFVIPDAAHRIHFTTTSMSAGQSIAPDSAQTIATGRITSLDADGFTIGTNADSNTDTETFFYLVLKNAASAFEVFTYTGDGNDDRDIATASFTPEGALVRLGTNTASTSMVGHFKDNVATESFQTAGTAPAANKIQGMITNGIQVGTDVSANEAAKIAYGLLFRTSSGAAGATALKRRLSGSSRLSRSLVA
jgi:hypothetical protein